MSQGHPPISSTYCPKSGPELVHSLSHVSSLLHQAQTHISSPHCIKLSNPGLLSPPLLNHPPGVAVHFVFWQWPLPLCLCHIYRPQWHTMSIDPPGYLCLHIQHNQVDHHHLNIYYIDYLHTLIKSDNNPILSSSDGFPAEFSELFYIVLMLPLPCVCHEGPQTTTYTPTLAAVMTWDTTCPITTPSVFVSFPLWFDPSATYPIFAYRMAHCWGQSPWYHTFKESQAQVLPKPPLS